MRRKIAITFIVVLIILSLYYVINNRRERMRMEYKDEQISTVSENEEDTSINSIQGNLTLSKIPSKPNNVILTGIPEHRLVTIYRTNKLTSTDDVDATSGRSYTEFDEDGNEYEVATHYVPGIQILYGYNLLNLGHYNIKSENLTYFFSKPALIKTVYFPSYTQDSINKIPVIRNYFLVSAYDEDTNKDKFINRKDLRKFYYFDIDVTNKIALLPPNYSATRSQYDDQNDVLYIFAKKDSNKNGEIDKNESLKIFWIDLKNPVQAKILY
jgi:hypothetical protein